MEKTKAELIEEATAQLNFSNNNTIHVARYMISKLNELIEDVKAEPMGDWSRDGFSLSIVDLELSMHTSAWLVDSINELNSDRVTLRKGSA